MRIENKENKKSNNSEKEEKKLDKYAKKIILIGLTIMICCSSFALISTKKVDSIEPFFTLVARTNGGGIRPDYLHLLQEQLARININVDVII